MKLYYANYTWSYPAITEFEVSKTTPQFYYVKTGTIRPIMGSPSLWQIRFKKNDENIFESISAAMRYLLRASKRKIKDANRVLDIAIENDQKLREFVDTVLANDQQLKDFMEITNGR